MNNRRILITGGAGFIGSHVVRWFTKRYPHYQIVNLDALTYAGNLSNLKDVESAANYTFIKADIKDFHALKSVFETHRISDVIHLAAESHVDRSIENPTSFAQTNVMGTINLLNCAKAEWEALDGHVFYHVSTDEVYGSLGPEGFFTEQTPYDPRSPYSASKAASDHMVRAYFHTYRLPVVISNCSNNYGPNQFPEKLIPLMINNILHRKPLPVYGSGINVRDWLWVEDHVTAIDLIFHKGQIGETYNVGGNCEMSNIELVRLICDLMDEALERPIGESRSLIRFVDDRPGHDLRYAIDFSKIRKHLGWRPSTPMEEGLKKTIQWYLDNQDWLEEVCSGEYRYYYEKHYNKSK